MHPQRFHTNDETMMARSFTVAGLLLFVGSIIGCRSQQTVQVLNYAQVKQLEGEYNRSHAPQMKRTNWVGPPATVTRLRQTKPTQDAIILGIVNAIEHDGRLTPLPATVSIDKTVLFADSTGSYSQVVPSGRHKVWVSWVGFLRSFAPPLQVKSGDSIRVDFYILPEFLPLE
ncbi:hypothetical protein ACFQT0_16435 [Hymenobacter humi]|uniref:Carboxypeptidase regulatory-like domain-containing protein n=1 Tax=Hymenobacter humi TaxID=1411620 RepID=A0ABW2U7A9_9BACT